ncbi:MAG: hypothetical protein E7H57_19800, partial [Pantoea sp.]|nr:hypothetical protein [Pantoea sp.]
QTFRAFYTRAPGILTACFMSILPAQLTGSGEFLFSRLSLCQKRIQILPLFSIMAQKNSLCFTKLAD